MLAAQKGWFSKTVVLANVLPERKPKRGYIRMLPRNGNQNEGTFACSHGTKNRNEGTKAFFKQRNRASFIEVVPCETHERCLTCVRDKQETVPGTNGTPPWDKMGPVPGTNWPLSVEFHSKNRHFVPSVLGTSGGSSLGRLSHKGHQKNVYVFSVYWFSFAPKLVSNLGRLENHLSGNPQSSLISHSQSRQPEAIVVAMGMGKNDCRCRDALQQHLVLGSENT